MFGTSEAGSQNSRGCSCSSRRRRLPSKVRRTSRSSTERAAVPPVRQNPGRLYRESGLVPWRRADVGPTIALRLEAPGTGSYPPLALSLGRLGQQVSVDPVQRSHQHGCPMMLSRLEWQPLAARHSYQVALRSLWFGMGLQVRPQGVAGLSLPEASRLQRTGCPRGSSPGTARPSCPPFSQSPAQSLHPRASILSDRQPQG